MDWSSISFQLETDSFRPLSTTRSNNSPRPLSARLRFPLVVNQKLSLPLPTQSTSSLPIPSKSFPHHLRNSLHFLSISLPCVSPLHPPRNSSRSEEKIRPSRFTTFRTLLPPYDCKRSNFELQSLRSLSPPKTINSRSDSRRVRFRSITRRVRSLLRGGRVLEGYKR